MNLKVLSAGADSPSWYADGLPFTCTQCGNCCTGGPGFVWLSKEEIVRLAAFLKITPEQTVEKYCRKLDGQFSLKERRGPSGGYDCIFLKEEKVTQKVRGESESGEQWIVLTRRSCSVYPVRPLQCRTWPFWPENLANKKVWDLAAQRCHGMNHGHRHFTCEQIETIRDAKDWPQSPPTSAPPLLSPPAAASEVDFQAESGQRNELNQGNPR